ncbi:Sensor histidine kinase YycG [compost metagenome]
MGNLLDNAIKYGKGPLTIETGRDGRDALFAVRDRGPGIPEQDLPHLFEPFYRPDTSRSRQSGGTGLGLAIVKTVAQSHGGEATLASQVGEGTTAAFRLPLREA